MLPFIKAKFKGVFKKTKSHHVGNFVHSDFNWTYIEITDCEKYHDFDVEVHKTHDYKFYKKISNNRFWKLGKKTEIFITSGEYQFYSDTIYNVLLKNIKLTKDETSLIGSDWREVIGDVYFQVEPKKKINDSILKVDKNVSGLNIIRNQNQTVVEHQRNIVSGFNNFSGSDSIVDIQGDGNSFTSDVDINSSIVQSLPISQSIGRWSKWISRILLGILFLLMLLYLWNSAKSFFYILVVLGFLWLLSRIVNLGSVFRIIGSLLLFGVIGYFILKLFYDTNTGSIPIKKREGNIKITPPKETDTNGDGKMDDATTEKDINWFDFSNQHYIARYNTSIASFQNSNNQQSELVLKTTGYNSSIDFFTKVYSGLFSIDETKIKNIAKIFSDSAAKKNLDAAQTAEMVVTFIQEIPYCLVHEGRCEDAMQSGNSFMIEYHQQHKPCLPNIVAGVQSPYEFLHNLKGDCDTRSLLAFSILKELNIASSVWVSEVYGHSILGVGVPVGYGLHKEINGVSHYGVELTAKGFRLGMVAPQNNNSNNWDITVYYNH
jgi:hypothetical protein